MDKLPVTKWLREAEPWRWGDPEEAAKSRVLLGYGETKYVRQPDLTVPFFIQTDTSAFGLGAVLDQDYADKYPNPRTVAFATLPCPIESAI